MKKRHGVKLVMVDYPQLLNSRDYADQGRQLETSNISTNLKAMAKELDVPVLVLSQLSRAPESRDKQGKPRISDLRDSGAIEQDADVVLLLWRPAYYADKFAGKLPEDETLAKVDVGKNRNGAVGVADLTFESEFTQFTDRAYAVDSGMPEEQGEAIGAADLLSPVKRLGRNAALGDPRPAVHEAEALGASAFHEDRGDWMKSRLKAYFADTLDVAKSDVALDHHGVSHQDFALVVARHVEAVGPVFRHADVSAEFKRESIPAYALRRNHHPVHRHRLYRHVGRAELREHAFQRIVFVAAAFDACDAVGRIFRFSHADLAVLADVVHLGRKSGLDCKHADICVFGDADRSVRDR